MPAMVGTSEIVITPTLPVPLSELGRDFDSVRGDLFVKALAVREGDAPADTFVLLVYDLIGFNADHVAATKARLREAFGLPAENVMLVTTQNHSAPKTMWEQGLTDPQGNLKIYFEQLERATDEAVRAALHAMTPAKVGFASGSAPYIGGNRRPLGKDGRCRMTWYRPPPQEVADWGIEDPAVHVARIEREGGAPLAVLFHFTCHPNTLWTTGAIGPDFPGVAAGIVKQALGANVPVFFINGFCGDVDPFKYMDVPRASFCWPEAMEPRNRHLVELCFGESEKFGKRLGDEIVRVLSGITCDQVVRAPAVTARRVEGRGRGKMVYDPRPSLELQALQLSPGWALLGMPCEPFIAIEQAIEKASPVQHTWCVQEANGYQGYLATSEEYPRGSYGVGEGACNFEPGMDKAVIAAAGEMLDDLHQARTAGAGPQRGNSDAL